ncbi:MAG: hypothetical protein AAGI37_21160 [Planctomycetota bacterium]
MPEQGCNGKTRVRRKVRYPDELKKRCMLLLQLRHDRFRNKPEDQVIKSATLARALKHWPGMKRETHRRRVRELVNEMRHEGAPIASGGGGYWIAKTVDDFQQTESFLRRHSLAELVTNAKIKQSAAAARAVGQLRFAPYHALISGRNALALYLKPSPNLQPVIDSALTAERSDQQWADSLFASA